MNCKHLFLMVCMCLLAAAGYAVHIKGGWMYYEYVNTDANGYNNYRIVVKLYRDCTPPNPGQNDQQINISIYDNGTNKVTNVPAPQSRNYSLEKGSFSECINPRPYVCYVVLEYTGYATLPPNERGYTASFQRCCRVNGIVNVNQPSNSFGNTYTISIPGNPATNNNISYSINSSPKFAEKDTVALCYNSPFELDYSATDADGDSLVYAFTGALSGASQNNPTPTTAQAPPYQSIWYGIGYNDTNPFGTNVTIDAHSGKITGISPAITGEYVVAVSIKEYRKGINIAETRKELHVNVAPCTIAGAELPLRITNCDGYDVQFENLSYSSAIHSYSWDFGVSNTDTDTSSQATPQYTYADTGVYMAKLVVNKGEACSDSATAEVRIFPGFYPDFTYVGSCVLNPFVFTDISTTRYGSINYHRWDFGNTSSTADTSITNPAQYKYPATGEYTVNLIVTSSKGCADTVSKQIEVLNKPLLTVAFKDTLICSIDSLQLKANGTGIFSWSPNTRMTNSSVSSPVVYPVDTTTYTVTLTDNGCVATEQIKVNTLDFITVDAGPDTTICRTDGVQLQPVTQGVGFNWSPAATLNNAFVRNPVATPTAASTTYTVIANLGKCTATDQVTIRTVPYPAVIAKPDTSICYGDTIMLRGSSTAYQHQWQPTQFVHTANSLITAAYPIRSTSFILRVTDTLGCPKPSFDTALVKVVPPLYIFAGNDTNIVVSQPLQLNAQSDGVNYKWSPTIGMNNPDIANPIVTIYSQNLPLGENNSIRYVLTATSPEGCKATDDIVLKIFTTSPSVFIPGAFTPNGDGKNDIFKPVLAGIKELIYFRIYNRYGSLVFETKEIGKGWDGRIKGELQSSAAFVYNCEAIDYNSKRVSLKGTVMLVR